MKTVRVGKVWVAMTTACVLWGGLGLAAEPYVIGHQTDITGMAKVNYAPEAEGFRLYIETLNAQGGIDGHPVKVVYEDDKSEPARAGAIAKKLIEEDQVLAIVGLGFSRSQPPVYELARKTGVPVLTGYAAIEPVWSTEPGDPIFAAGYVMHPKYHPGGVGFAKVLAKLHPKGSTAAFSSYDTPGGRVWTDSAAHWSEKFGYKVVYKEDIPPGTVDLSPWAQKVAALNPAMYCIAIGGEVLIPMASALEKLGWTKDLLVPDFVTEGNLEKAVERLMTGGDWILWFGRYASAYENLPEFTKIRKAMETYGHQYPLSARHAQGWTMARLMEAALRRAGWPCTRADLIAALEKTDLDTKGLTGGPIRFTRTDHYGPTWWKAYRWNAGKKALLPVTDWIQLVTADFAAK